MGSGTYGNVLLASKRDDPKTQVALKRLQLPSCNNGDERMRMERFAKREMWALKELGGHPNIVHLLGVFRDAQDNVYMAMPLAAHDLSGLLACQQATHMPAGQLKGYVFQLFQAIAYCHERGVMHRDIKAENVLIMSDNVVKLADFGLAREMQLNYDRYTSPVQTLWGRSPELLLGFTAYDERSDVWAAVCVLLQCLLRKPLLPGQDEKDQLVLIYKLCGTPQNVARDWPPALVTPIQKSLHLVRGPLPKAIRARLGPEQVIWRRDLFTPGLLDVAERGLELNPVKRSSMKELLDMPYFTQEYPRPYSTEQMIVYPEGQRTSRVLFDQGKPQRGETRKRPHHHHHHHHHK